MDDEQHPNEKKRRGKSLGTGTSTGTGLGIIVGVTIGVATDNVGLSVRARTSRKTSIDGNSWDSQSTPLHARRNGCHLMARRRIRSWPASDPATSVHHSPAHLPQPFFQVLDLVILDRQGRQPWLAHGLAIGVHERLEQAIAA